MRKDLHLIKLFQILSVSFQISPQSLNLYTNLLLFFFTRSKIQDCEANGRALCQRGGADGIIERLTDSDAPEILNNIGQWTVDQIVRDLISERRVEKYSFTTTGGRKWLGTTNGVMSRGEYEAVTARDNV